MKSWDKVDIKNVLVLVVIYKFGVSIGGNSARGRPQAGRAAGLCPKLEGRPVPNTVCI